jgi:hypothetical protein
MIQKIQGHDTEHYYVLHKEGNCVCYIGKSDSLPHEYKNKLRTYTYFGSQLKRINLSEATFED